MPLDDHPRLAALVVRPHALGDYDRLGDGRGDDGDDDDDNDDLVRVQQHAEELHRELILARAVEALGSLPGDDSTLEEPAALEELHVEPPVLLAIRGRLVERLAELVDAATQDLDLAAEERA